MADVRGVADSVMKMLNSQTRDISPQEYKEVLELLSEDIEVRLDAATSGATDDDGEDSYEQNAIQGTSR